MERQPAEPSPREIEEAVARELGWSPLRDVPVEFAQAVARAEAAALAHHRDNDRRLLDERTQRWEAIRTHPGFAAAPLPFRLDALNRSAITFLERYAVTAADADFAAAAERWEQALAIASADWPERGRYLHNLGSLFRVRYGRSGALADLERSIDLLQNAVDQPNLEARYRGLFHNTLGVALAARYDRQGTLDDLESAIVHGETSLELAPPLDPQRPIFLAHLGLSYRRRFIRTHAEADIQRSVALLEEAVTHTGQRRSQPYRLTNLGNALLDRFSLLGQGEDATRALHAHRQAVDMTRTDDPNLPIRLNNLGNSLSSLYRTVADPPLLDEAIETYRRSLRHTAKSDPLRASRLYNLGRMLLTRHTLSRGRDDQRAATRALRQACRFGLEQHLEWALSAARVWGEWAESRKAWKEAGTAYAFGMEAIDRLYQTQLLAESQVSWLREARDLAGQAAYVLARNRDDRQAVAVLERGRARALNEALTRQEALLAAIHADDREALHAALASVEALQAELRSVDSSSSRPYPAVASDLRRAREAVRERIDRIRANHTGFMPERVDFEAVAAQVKAVGQPLVYVLTARSGSVAQIILPDRHAADADVHTVRIDGFTTDSLSAILHGEADAPGYLHGIVDASPDEFQVILDVVFRELTRGLMDPLVAALRELGISRALLVPTGTLTLLPLHAAVPDDIVLSYLPSGRALRTVFLDRDHVDLPVQLLAVGNPFSRLQPALRFANIEAERIAGLFSAKGHAPKVILQRQATRRTIALHLPGATHLHFACHGRFDVEHPLESALYLAGDDTLTLQALLHGTLDVSAIRLVTLSACQTGLVDFVHVPDEVVGFPAGLIQAGVPGVISTLWPVDDASTAILLARFYELHLDEGLEPGAALHAAQRWLRDATAEEIGLATIWESLFRASDRSETSAFRWMRYFRANPRERPFAHPYYWAAFSFTGI